MISKVSIVKCSSYSNVKKSVENCIKLIGRFDKILNSEDNVLLKPNLINPISPEKAATTHPLFVKAVAELVKEIGCEVWIGDCSFGFDPQNTENTLKVTGMMDVAKELGVKLINFHRDKQVRVKISKGKILKEVILAESVVNADAVINLPKLKTHGMTFFTGAVKNLYGCLPGEWKNLVHKKLPDRNLFSHALLDIYSTIKPKLTIMDAVIGMEGEKGPCYGKPKKIGLVIGSEDGIAVDSVSCEIVGYPVNAILTNRFGRERNLGQTNIKKMRVVGESIEKIKVKDFEKTSLMHYRELYKKYKGFGERFLFKPMVDIGKCSECGVCAENCPVGAIKLEPHPIFDRDKCIRCYCCQEGCPNGAIAFKKTFLSKPLDLSRT